MPTKLGKQNALLPVTTGKELWFTVLSLSITKRQVKNWEYRSPMRNSHCDLSCETENKRKRRGISLVPLQLRDWK